MPPGREASNDLYAGPARHSRSQLPPSKKRCRCEHDRAYGTMGREHFLGRISQAREPTVKEDVTECIEVGRWLLMRVVRKITEV